MLLIFLAIFSYVVMFKHGPFEWEQVIGQHDLVTLQELISDVKVDVDK